jgi:hypothetical protein
MIARWFVCFSLGLLVAVSLTAQQPAAKKPQVPAKTVKPAVTRDLVVAKDPIQQLPPGSKRFALVIGVDKYDDPQLNSLRGAANDARILADAFIRYAGFPASQTILLSSDQPEERRPTRSNILVRLSNMASMVPEDGLLLLAFAGHGMERENQVFLLPSDARSSNNVRVLQQTALNVNDIRDWIKETKVKQVLMLLDACRNDPVASRATGPNLMTDNFKSAFDFDVRNSSIEAFATLYATKVGSRAYEYAEKKQGYFTWAIAEGLKGKAAGANGEVTLASLQKYVQETVPRQVRLDLGDVDQRPFAEIRGYRAEELVLSKVQPGTIPNASGLEMPDPATARTVEMEEYSRVSNSSDPAALTAFIGKYPASPMVEQLQHRIATIAWQKVSESKDIAALRGYMTQFPNSAYTAFARQKITVIESEDASRAGIQTALAQYVRAYRSKSFEQLRAIYPSLSRSEQSTIQDFFRMARSINFDLKQLADPQIDGTSAVVNARRTVQFSDQSGTHPEAQGQVRVKLRTGGDGVWVIEVVEPIK